MEKTHASFVLLTIFFTAIAVAVEIAVVIIIFIALTSYIGLAFDSDLSGQLRSDLVATHAPL